MKNNKGSCNKTCAVCKIDYFGHHSSLMCQTCATTHKKCACGEYGLKKDIRREPLTTITYCPSCMKERYIPEIQKIFNETNSYDWIECKICGDRKEDLSLHIGFSHGITCDEYKQKYGAQVKSQKLCDRIKGDKNPGYQHGGSLSPWSNKSEHFTNEQVESCKARTIKAVLDNPNSAIHSTKIEYFLDKGMSEEDAQKALTERQSTFSLDKCQEKYGIIEGLMVWQERQDKWQTTLGEKTDEEIAEINRKKIYKNGLKSKVESELADLISNHVEIEQQFMIRNDERYYLYDIKVGNKIVEFNGDYWHANPNKYKCDDVMHRGRLANEIWEADRNKIDQANNNGYEVLVIWEADFKKDKEKVLDKCLKFLTT